MPHPQEASNHFNGLPLVPMLCLGALLSTYSVAAHATQISWSGWECSAAASAPTQGHAGKRGMQATHQQTHLVNHAIEIHPRPAMPESAHGSCRACDDRACVCGCRPHPYSETALLPADRSPWNRHCGKSRSHLLQPG